MLNYRYFFSQCLGLTGEKLVERTVDFVDIAYDEVSPKHYKEEEVLTLYDTQYSNNTDNNIIGWLYHLLIYARFLTTTFIGSEVFSIEKDLEGPAA